MVGRNEDEDCGSGAEDNNLPINEFMQNVFPWKTITICLLVIAAAQVIKCANAFI